MVWTRLYAEQLINIEGTGEICLQNSGDARGLQSFAFERTATHCLIAQQRDPAAAPDVGEPVLDRRTVGHDLANVQHGRTGSTHRLEKNVREDRLDVRKRTDVICPVLRPPA